MTAGHRVLAALFVTRLLVAVSPSPSSAAEPPLFPRASVAAAGSAKSYGSTGNVLLSQPLVDIARTPNGKGYWLLAGDGGVFSYGNARFYGSTGNLRLVQPAVQMAATKTGKGYWFVAGDGGVFSFGDARFYGSMGGRRLAAPMVGIMPTPTGRGYWLVAADGGVFSFGDARFRGSLGALKLGAPIVAGASTVTNRGYWLLGADGGVFALGDARYRGRAASLRPFVDIAARPDGAGYAAVNDYGQIQTFGGRALPRAEINWHAGSVATGLAITPDSRGAWVVTSGRAPFDEIATATGAFRYLQRMQWDRCRLATWHILDTGKPVPAGGEAFLAELFDYVNRATGMQFRFGGGAPYLTDARNTIFVGWDDLSGISEAVAGVGKPLFESSGTVLLDVRSHDWSWRIDGTGKVAIHEVGHAMGLDHQFFDPTSVMDYNRSQWRFGPGDLAGLRGQITCG